MEQKLIETMIKLTDAIQELNKKLSKPLEVNSEVYNIGIELKHELQDLKISVEKLHTTMSEE